MTPALANPQTGRSLPVWVKLLLLLFVLYAFFVSIELLSSSIKLFGKGLAEHLFTLTSNPMVALFIGLGATSLMQSSSATTSMVVAMVASGALDLSLLVAVALLFGAITQLTRVLKSIFIGSAEGWFQTRLFNHPAKALALGLVLTALVQSSSITTSMIVPIAGAGLLTIEQIFPYTLGANIGTTVTAILASLAAGKPEALAIALVHLLFNAAGTILVWPVKRFPVWLAETLAAAAVRSKLVPLAYVTIVFFLVPLGVIFLTR